MGGSVEEDHGSLIQNFESGASGEEELEECGSLFDGAGKGLPASSSRSIFIFVEAILSGNLSSMELIFEVREAEEGGYTARALGHSIFTEAESWDELRENVLEAASLHFEDAAEQPKLVQLHFVKDELIAVQAA